MNVTFKKVNEFKNQADKIFVENKQKIIKVLPNVEVDHIGSSAISNSITKGDLDINVRVFPDDFKSAIENLKGIYEINQPENWTETFASFKDDTSFELPVGVQLTVIGSKYDDFVKLRDLLINKPKLLEEYNQMKLKYEGKEMDEYRKEKAEFFEKLRKLLK